MVQVKQNIRKWWPNFRILLTVWKSFGKSFHRLFTLLPCSWSTLFFSETFIGDYFEKQDKSSRLIQNWRSISLTNVDLRIVSKAFLRDSNFFSPKLFITTKMDLWNEDLCLMQCGPSGIVWEWKIALGSWLLSNLKKQMILLPMFAGYKFSLTGGWYARLVDSPINLWYGPKKEFRAKRCCSTNPCFVIIKWTFLKNFKPLEVE